MNGIPLANGFRGGTRAPSLIAAPGATSLAMRSVAKSMLRTHSSNTGFVRHHPDELSRD